MCIYIIYIYYKLLPAYVARWRHKTDIYSGAPYCSPLDVLLVILRAVGEFNIIVFGCFGSNHLLGRFGVISHLFVRFGVGFWEVQPSPEGGGWHSRAFSLER